MKFTSSHFLDYTDLSSANLRAGENEPQTFFNGKLEVSAPKRHMVEVSDILPWTEAFFFYLSNGFLPLSSWSVMGTFHAMSC